MRLLVDLRYATLDYAILCIDTIFYCIFFVLEAVLLPVCLVVCPSVYVYWFDFLFCPCVIKEERILFYCLLYLIFFRHFSRFECVESSSATMQHRSVAWLSFKVSLAIWSVFVSSTYTYQTWNFVRLLWIEQLLLSCIRPENLFRGWWSVINQFGFVVWYG